MALLSALLTRAAKPSRRWGMPGAWAVRLAVLLLGGGPGLAAQTARASEYQLKAVFLFNFAQFVDWPADTFSDADTPVVIGVLGEDPFGSVLDQTVRDERLRGRPFQVRSEEHTSELQSCHILFIRAP